MSEIVDLSTDFVVIMYPENNNFTATYYNSPQGRLLAQSALGDDTMWQSEIIPVWGDTPTVSDPSETPTIPVSKIRSDKQQQIKTLCHNKIVEGIDADVGLTDDEGNPLGTLHYTLSEKNQTDMRDLVSMIAQGATEVTWRDDSRVSHMVYTAQQFLTLYKLSSQHILRCRFKSDALEELVRLYSDDEADKIGSVDWDSEIPPEIEDKMNTLLDIMLKDANEGGV